MIYLRILVALLIIGLLTGCMMTPSSYSSTMHTETNTTSISGTTTVAATTVPTTMLPTTAPTAKSQVRALLEDGRLANMYRASYRSIFDRVGENGYLQESLTGKYRGEYVRSVGALAILATMVGETAAAGCALRFVTDVMQKKDLPYLPFTISADGNTANTADELDGRAHFVLGWALYITQSGDTAYFQQTYPLMRREVDAFCSDAYFYEDWHLMRNRRFTHTRVRGKSDYHDAFDLLTNSFVAAALEKMISVAAANGHESDTGNWKRVLSLLQKGIGENLTHTVNGKTVYLEMRYFDGGKGTPERGVSWVCLAPYATASAGVDNAILAATTAQVRKVLWRETIEGGYLAVEADDAGRVKNWILGKSLGWDIAAAVQAEDYTHILELLRFLERYHTADIYMEQMHPQSGGWRLVDGGNAEQLIWFLYGMAKLRHEVGLSYF